MRMVMPLRRYNDTLRIPMPIEYARQSGLQEGDQVIWTEDEDGVRLRFVRVAELPAIPKRATETANAE
jgi:bifunctional DNA-binding transcriptional regulator/antitoxin component of YhaV-PrlF toxin-antitoxin module